MLRKGDLIKLRGYKGKSIIRRFLGVKNETVLICSDDEFRAARRERRNPIAVGFQFRDVLSAKARKSISQQIEGFIEAKSSSLGYPARSTSHPRISIQSK